MATHRSTSESDDRDFDEKLVKLSDIKSFFTCTICAGLFNGTNTTICGHRFCAHCLQGWFERQRKCPICTKGLRADQGTRDHQFDDLLRTIKDKAVSEADIVARQLLESNQNGNNNNGPGLHVDHKLAEVLCTLLPQKDRDLKEMMDKLIAEKDKALRTLKERELPERDKQIQLLQNHAKKLEEELKQVKTLQGKLEKSQQSEAKCNEEKHQLKGELQRLNGELTTLRTVDVTRQQKIKELHGQLQQQVAEIQALNMSLDEKTKVAAKADSLQKTVSQLERDLQQKINEVTYLHQFVMFKDLYERRNQEARSLEQDLSTKDATILEQQHQIISMNGKISAMSKQIQETPMSIHQAEIRYQKQLQEMTENMRAFYERKAQTDIGLIREHSEELARDLEETRSKHLEEMKKMHEENMKLLREVDMTRNSGRHQVNDERCQQLAASLNYYKNKVNELEQRLTILQNRSNSP